MIFECQIDSLTLLQMIWLQLYQASASYVSRFIELEGSMVLDVFDEAFELFFASPNEQPK